jgi:hypothetical protein
LRQIACGPCATANHVPGCEAVNLPFAPLASA